MRLGRRSGGVQNAVVALVVSLMVVLGVGAALRSSDPGAEQPSRSSRPTMAADGASPAEDAAVALEDLGAAVIAYGGRSPGLKVYRDDGGVLVWRRKVDMALADNVGGVVVQSRRTIAWLPQADPGRTRTLVKAGAAPVLRAILPGDRVLYSIADTKRSEDMVERFFTVQMVRESRPQLFATDPAFERWGIGPAVTADKRLIMASCHMMCSIYAWPSHDRTFPYPEALYHGGADDTGANAAIDGLTATPDGRVIGMIEFLPQPGFESPELVLLNSRSFQRVAAITLPVDKDRALGALHVSLSADGRALVSIASRRDDPDAPWRHDVFLVDDARTPAPRIRRVDFDGVVRWIAREPRSS